MNPAYHFARMRELLDEHKPSRGPASAEFSGKLASVMRETLSGAAT